MGAMQLHLETDELNVVANILLERIGSASTHGVRLGGGQRDESLRPVPRVFNSLLDKILARDLRLDSDELEQLVDLLNTERGELTQRIAHAGDTSRQTELQRNLSLLDRVRERVSEACVMF
jgi:hypothetical protein